MHRINEDLVLSKGQRHQDVQENELVARRLVPLCSSGYRRVRKLVRIHTRNPDPVGGVHFGKGRFDVVDGDQVILFGYAGDESGKAKVKNLMIGLDAGGEATNFRTGGFDLDGSQRVRR